MKLLDLHVLIILKVFPDNLPNSCHPLHDVILDGVLILTPECRSLIVWGRRGGLRGGGQPRILSIIVIQVT